MKIERAFLIVITASLLVAPGVAGAETPITVHLTDGTAVEGIGPVNREGGLVVFRLAGGPLVSLSERTIDRITSGESEPAAPVTPTVAPGPPSARVSAPQASTTLRFSNSDLPPPILTAPAPPQAVTAPEPAPSVVADQAGMIEIPSTLEPPPAPKTEPQQPVIPSYANFRDRNGNGAEYWQARKADLANRLEFVRAEIANLQNALAGKNKPRLVVRTGSLADRDDVDDDAPELVPILRRDAIIQLEAAINQETDLEKAVESLGEEAHRAGALPGWLR